MVRIPHDARGEKRRTLHNLSALAVRKASKPGLYADGGNLYLQVARGGSKSWVFRYRRAGRLHDLGLGSERDFTLAEARERARRLRQMLADGRDPLTERLTERAARAAEAAARVTFRQATDAFLAAHRAGWRNAKHAAQWSATLATYAFPVFGEAAVDAIDTSLVLKAVEPIWAAKPETASRVRGRIEAILDWATARGYRRGENPARWRGHLDKLLPAPSRAKAAVRRQNGGGAHFAALPYDELPAFMTALRAQEGIAARALEFGVLTAARTGEVIGARWDEINFADRLWTIPAARMKAGREHRVPLSDAAMAILESMAAIRQNDFVFAGIKPERGLSNMALAMVLRRMGRGDLTVHGFRSTFRDWAAERTNFPAEVAEMALAHVVSDKVEAAYRRGDLFEKRRQLAAAWARYCATPAADGGGVVTLQRRRA